jgi:non-specific serine/threonine protein kinase
MLVIHGLWTAGALCCWAEDAHAASSPPARRSGRPPRQRPHPFAVPAGELAATLGRSRRGTEPLGRSGGRESGGDGELALLLPTRGGAPVPSPELPVEAPPARESTVTAAMWRVPVVMLRDGAEALSELLGPQDEAPDELAHGSDLRLLRELAVFAEDLVARGRVLPTLLAPATGRPAARHADNDPGAGGDRPRAVWRPVLTGPDAAWARALALAMPPSAAAVVPDGDDAPRGGTRRVVAQALDALVDAAARRRLADPAVPPTGRPPATGRAAATSARTSPVAGRGAAATAGAWLRALTDAESSFDATPAEVTRLGTDLAAWQRDALGRPVRARFRLVEPPEIVAPVVVVPAPAPGDGPPPDADGDHDEDPDRDAGPEAPWRLEFALQATREPSLVVDAQEVWTGDEPTTPLHRWTPTPRQALLAELGRAQRLVPALDGALRTARPSVLELDTAGAHAFLTGDAATLAAAGFGVELPGWWGRPAGRLGARLTAGTPAQPGIVAGTSAIGQRALLEYRWDLAIGDHTLTEEELRSMARLQQPLVRLRGQWVEVDAKALRTALKALERKASGEMSVADLFAALASDQAGPGGLEVVAVEAEGWLGDLLSGTTEQRLEPVSAPDGFDGRLRPYQERGLAWLAFTDRLGLGAVLADDMGLGKTVQLLALIAGDRASATGTDDGAGPTLLVCPMSLVGNWQREASRFVPDLRVHVHHGSDRARGEEFAEAVASSDLVITTYAIATRDVEALGAVQWRRVVLDEAQAVKNAATKQASAVRALPAAHRVAVTGTPVENRLADLWSLMDFANPGLLGKAAAFRERFAVPIERHGDDDAAARLRTLTQPFVLRRLKTDRSIISDLPEKLEMEVLCSLTAEQAALYQATVDEMLEKIEASEGIERRGLVLATMTRLKQVCNHPAQLLRDGSRLSGRSGKLARVEEVLEEVLAAGEKALLFTQFAEFGGMLRAHLSARFGREVLFLHGGVPKAERDAMVARFSGDEGADASRDPGRRGDADGDRRGGATGPALFVLSLKAGGTGLNLTAANHVIHVDRWWNPAVEDQATDRAFRIGQRRAVQVRKLVCAGTLEERIAEMIREKRGLAARIVGAGEGWLTELSTAQLRDLLRLDTSAVAE